jgi:hypothetical protein
MLAAFATLAFLVTMWLLVVVGSAILEESGAKIAAALKGESLASRQLSLAPVRPRSRAKMRQPLRARPRWRDAA